MAENQDGCCPDSGISMSVLLMHTPNTLDLTRIEPSSSELSVWNNFLDKILWIVILRAFSEWILSMYIEQKMPN